MQNTKRNLTALATIAGLALGSSAQAASIVWTQGTITGDSIVDTTGTLMEAANFGDNTVTSPTINAVTFTGVDFGSSPTLSNLSGLGYDGGNNGTWSSTGETIDQLANTLARESGVGSQSATLTGLTDGAEYLVQFFIDHSTDTTMDINDGLGNTVTLNTLGEYATGTFTADGATQALNFSIGVGSQKLSGYQLRAVPEPSAAALIGLSALGLLRRRR